MSSAPGSADYELLEHDTDEYYEEEGKTQPKRQIPLLWRAELLVKTYPKQFFISILMLAILLYSLFTWPFWKPQPTRDCDSIDQGYQCQPEISHYWGQYSPYFSVPSDISADVPKGCQITFVQVLSRHGARDPTRSKSIEYSALVKNIHASVKSFKGKYAFLKDYQYTLGSDELTTFGRRHMLNSGIKFYRRYKSLAMSTVPFIRASDQKRVVDSGDLFVRGFHEACVNDTRSKTANCTTWPYPRVDLSEKEGSHNPLDHGLCGAFEKEHEMGLDKAAQNIYREVFATPITARLNKELPRLSLDNGETIMVMDLCPFETVENSSGNISPFCNLFSPEEWQQYDYYQTLGKYYGFANHDCLGPTQGVGFTNELISRMTKQPVNDRTSVDHELDSDPKTFPLGDAWRIYADFTHDNTMVTILAAMGIFNHTLPLANETLQDAHTTGGFSSSWLTPFGARMYFEKLKCPALGSDKEEEYVRIIINDRVQPLKSCKGDALGRCKLSDFIDSLGFARTGGRWDDCWK